MRGSKAIAGSAVALAAALLLVASSSAVVVERVSLADAGRPLTQILPPGVFLVLVSPPEYARQSGNGTGGSWLGPEYRATGNGSVAGRATLAWKLGFDNRAKDTEEAARAALAKGWKETLRGGISVPHVVGKQAVGTLDGDFVLTVSPGDGDAAHEAAMAFPVAPRLHAVITFEAGEPATDSAGELGKHIVLNGIPASTWNRGQSIRAMAGVRIDGNLPPTRITAVASGRSVRGTVADAFRHSLVAAPVALERLADGSWRRLTSTRTDKRGGYSIRVGSRGRYRAVATLGQLTVTSRPVRAG